MGTEQAVKASFLSTLDLCSPELRIVPISHVYVCMHTFAEVGWRWWRGNIAKFAKEDFSCLSITSVVY